MANGAPRRGSLFGALLLIALGALFLASNLIPQWDAWPFLSRYWPVLLIAFGLGKLFDALRAPGPSGPPGAAQGRRRTGEGIAIVALLALVCVALAGGRGRFGGRMIHETKSVDAQGAESVRVSLDMPAGDLRISGGAMGKLLDANFDYAASRGQPQISYDAAGKDGHLSITQSGRPLTGRSSNTWNLRFNDEAVRELNLQMGAGRGDLNLNGIQLTRLGVEIGAGEIIANLTGDWKHDVDVQIQGGVGSATVRLPKGVGVRVHAEGGIGSIDVQGLRKEDGYYVNEAYGKSPVTMKVDVEGGIGEIRLIEER